MVAVAVGGPSVVVVVGRTVTVVSIAVVPITSVHVVVVHIAVVVGGTDLEQLMVACAPEHGRFCGCCSGLVLDGIVLRVGDAG